jgi:hypothetical protein
LLHAHFLSPPFSLLQGLPVLPEEAADARAAMLVAAADGAGGLHAPLYLGEQVLLHTAALSYHPEVGASLLQSLLGTPGLVGWGGISMEEHVLPGVQQQVWWWWWWW